jgi:hypothetical protein
MAAVGAHLSDAWSHPPVGGNPQSTTPSHTIANVGLSGDISRADINGPYTHYRVNWSNASSHDHDSQHHHENESYDTPSPILHSGGTFQIGWPNSAITKNGLRIHGDGIDDQTSATNSREASLPLATATATCNAVPSLSSSLINGAPLLSYGSNRSNLPMELRALSAHNNASSSSSSSRSVVTIPSHRSPQSDHASKSSPLRIWPIDDVSSPKATSSAPTIATDNISLSPSLLSSSDSHAPSTPAATRSLPLSDISTPSSVSSSSVTSSSSRISSLPNSPLAFTFNSSPSTPQSISSLSTPNASVAGVPLSPSGDSVTRVRLQVTREILTSEQSYVDSLSVFG